MGWERAKPVLRLSELSDGRPQRAKLHFRHGRGYSSSGRSSPGHVPVAFANASRDLWSIAARVPLKIAPSSAAAATTLPRLGRLCSGFGGSWSSMTPQTCSNSFLPRNPEISPPVMLTGMNRIFIREGNVYPDAPSGIPGS